MTREQLKAMLPEGTENSVVSNILDALHSEIKIHQDAATKATKDLSDKSKAYDDLQAKYDADTKAANDRVSAMEFNSKLEGKLTAKGARNLKAAKALLDMDALKASKNGDADMDAAIEALIKGEDTAFVFAAQPTGGKADVGAPTRGGSGGRDGVEAAFAALNPSIKLD